jgi:twitching motility two-component system response regulator PilG
MHNTGTFIELSPQELLKQLVSCSDSTCLQAFSPSVSWLIYINQGHIIYATHSVEPFDKLERHMRLISQPDSLLTDEIRLQLRLSFEPDGQIQPEENYAIALNHLPEYQAIKWLIQEKILLPAAATGLIREIVGEVVESFLLITAGTYQLHELVDNPPAICKIDIEEMIEHCQARLQIWQSLTPHITSPYQRPYPLIQTKLRDQQLPELAQNLASWVKGFSLRHLAVLFHQDEVQLAQTLHPHILSGAIILHEADPPFDLLPKIDVHFSSTPQYITQTSTEVVEHINDAPTKFQISENSQTDEISVVKDTSNPEKIHKILSVDDSPTLLREISRFLSEEKFSVVTVNEPIKAVMSIIRHKPDLILLDLNMAGIDGYELCRVIRNNSLFKEVPIIFVTGNKGIVDKVKARIVGASGYLTKPFTRADLMKIIFMHLN